MSEFNSISDITEAVNTLLACAGETPVVDAESSTSVIAAQALNTLKETHRRVLAKGWTFNKEYDVELSPGVDGNITLPGDIIEVDTKDYNEDLDPVMRGQRLYSKKNNSYTWEEPITVSQVRLLEFNEVPEAFRIYVTIRAARVFVSRHVGDDASYKYTANDESLAYADIRRFEVRNGDYNIFKNYDVAKMLDRRA